MLESKRATRLGVPLLLCVLFFGVQSWLLAGERKSANSQVVIVADGGAPPPVTIAQQSRSLQIPKLLYTRAWRLIRDTFYEQKFNGQDWNRWEHHYDGKLQSTDDAHKAIETMLCSLADPYTRFLDKEAFDDEKSQIEAHLFGVGMQLGMNQEHKIVVISPIEGTPAYEAGMHPGDEIVEVDSKPVKGQSLDQVVKQIRGLINTKVTITYMRKHEKKKVTLTRAEIPIRAVANHEILPGNIGYIRLESFISHKANKEMQQALKTMEGCDGLILDLRNNPGGLLSNAIEIAGMFIQKGVIVSIVDAEGYKNSTLSNGQVVFNAPMVILINKGSASASEILSGALRDNGRAKLVGEKSFGKGLVQAINKLDDGSGINVTIAKYLTPNDTDINKTGIIPDFEVPLKDDDLKKGIGPWWIDLSYQNFKKAPTDGKDAQLNKAIEVIKKDIAESKNQPTTAHNAGQEGSATRPLADVAPQSTDKGN